MAPKRVGPLDNAIRKVLTNSLATRFCVSSTVAGKFLPKVVEQWGKLRRLEGGDIMHAVDIVSKCVDGRDASFIRVRELIAKYSWKITYLSFLPNSTSNSLIETGVIEMLPMISSYNRFLGNFGASLSFPFPKARSLRRRSPKSFVSLLFGKLCSTHPMLMACLRFRFIRRPGPWTPLTSNPSSALSVALKTGKTGGWSTAVVHWPMQYSLRRINRWQYDPFHERTCSPSCAVFLSMLVCRVLFGTPEHHPSRHARCVERSRAAFRANLLPPPPHFTHHASFLSPFRPSNCIPRCPLQPARVPFDRDACTRHRRWSRDGNCGTDAPDYGKQGRQVRLSSLSLWQC